MKNMQAAERFDGELGMGCSKSSPIFQSDIFNVSVWTHQSGNKKTEIECKPLPYGVNRIYLKGEHILDSEEKCLEQYSFEEISLMLDGQKANGIKEGKELKILEINKCLSITQE
jgi:hypothetical protein